MHAAAASDKELVLQILSGQREAFSALVERHLRSALAIARARLLNPIDADDAVQEAFLRAYAQLRTLREPAKFGPWLLTIVRHEAARFVARGRSTVGADPAAAPEAVAEPNPSQREVHAILRSRIEQLPETAREVLLLHYFAGRNTREIAELLDLRQAAVLKRLQRAREALADNLLDEIKGDRPSPQSTAKQIARIAALASAIPLQQAAAAAGTFSLAGLPVLTKVVAVFGVVGVSATIAVTTFRREPATDATPPRGQILVAAQLEDPEATAPGTRSAAPPAEATATAPAASSPPTEKGDQTATADLSRPVPFDAERQHIAEVLAALAEQSGLNILIDQRAVGVPSADHVPPPASYRPYASDGKIVRFEVQAKSPLDAIEQAVVPLGLKTVLAPGYLFISTPQQIRLDGYKYEHADYAHYPDWDVPTPVPLHFENVHISELIEFISEAHNKNIVLDYRVVPPAEGSPGIPLFRGRKTTDGEVEYINLRDIRLIDALRAIGRLENLRVAPRGDYFWISSGQLLRRDRLPPVPPDERAKLEKLENSPITVAFEEVHLKEIFGFIREIYDVAVILDQRVVHWDDEPASGIPLPGVNDAAPSISHGVLQRLPLKGVSLRSALDIATRSLDLAYTMQDDRVIVSNPNLLQQKEGLAQNAIPAKEFVSQMQQPIQPSARKKRDLPLLIDVRKEADGDKVRIDTGLSSDWYGEGEAVEEYRVTRVDATANTAELLNVQTNTTLTLVMTFDRTVTIRNRN